MQVYGNVATAPVCKTSKVTGKPYYEFRLGESQRGVASTSTTWYTIRIMKGENPGLALGDFVKVTGSLKTDFYMNRDGLPTGTHLIIAFEASKIAKPSPSPSPASAPAAEDTSRLGNRTPAYTTPAIPMTELALVDID